MVSFFAVAALELAVEIVAAAVLLEGLPDGDATAAGGVSEAAFVFFFGMLSSDSSKGFQSCGPLGFGLVGVCSGCGFLAKAASTIFRLRTTCPSRGLSFRAVSHCSFASAYLC